jgi:hypothetical protein
MVAAALSSVVALPIPAMAAGELKVQVQGGGPLVDLTRLAPGSVRQSTVSAANNSGDDGVLRLRLADLHEDDHGCVGPERAYGDVTCGDGEGELGRDLTVAVVPLAADGRPDGPAVFDGSIRDLVTWTTADSLLPAGTERSFRLDWELPMASPNDTQTDTVAFAMEFELEQAVSGGPTDSPAPPAVPPSVEGETLIRPSPTGSVGGTLSDGPASDTLVVGKLPRTGLPIGSLTAWGGALAVAGCAVRAATRRRRRRPA